MRLAATVASSVPDACQGPIAHVAYGTLMTAIRADVQGYAINPTRSLRALRETRIGQ